MRCEKNTRGSQHTTDRKQADKAVQLPRIKYAPMPSAEVIKKKKKIVEKYTEDSTSKHHWGKRKTWDREPFPGF